MRFAAPFMTAWLWTVPAVIVFFIYAGKARRKALKRFASERLLSDIAGSFDPGRRRLRQTMLTFALLFMALSLMRPQWGFRWQEVKRKGLDILVALDTSNSMLAEDVAPNRIERSRLAIKDLVKKLHGDRIGLIVFSGTAFLQCPLTVDYNGFMLSLNDVSVESIPVGGTSIARAIYTAIDSYEGGTQDQKVLIIITDGEDLEGGLEKAVQAAKARNIRIYCVGIGTPEGELIPVTDGSGKTVFLKDEQGNVVKTRLVEDTLKRMALETGGIYVRASGAEFGLDLIYEKGLSQMEKRDFESKMQKQYFDRFQLPLAFALFLILAEVFVSEKKKSRQGRLTE
ncbi:MAG: VWA domain-containing protein [Candidatus Omnitrophica bacterium]|nr:VWA domain-containing protein [Candidatus Omnitrophota bacterium]